MPEASSTSSDADWRPTPRQRAFLESKAYEALYGGAAGGGKSEALLAGALRWVDSPHFRGLILRRTYADLDRSLIERSRALFRAAFAGAEYNEMNRRWRFPSGAILYFGHLEHEKDKYNYQSAEFSYIAFDELTHFTETQYTYMLSRARSSKGLPIRIRAATNPGGDGHEWVMRRWSPWLDPRADAITAEPGQILHYRNAEDGSEWCERTTPGALSRVFIPAKVTDNPHLTKNDPDYVERLRGLDRVTRAQLLDGNWLVKVGAGAALQARLVRHRRRYPHGLSDCRSGTVLGSRRNARGRSHQERAQRGLHRWCPRHRDEGWPLLRRGRLTLPRFAAGSDGARTDVRLDRCARGADRD